MTLALLVMAEGGATITARLGLDIKPFQTGLQQANTEAIRHAGNVGRAAGAHDRLFTSSHRVANRVGELARAFTSGGSAADVFAVGIEGLGRSLNLPLGVLAAIATTGVLVQQIYKSQSEINKLNRQIDALAAGHANERFESLETLKTRAEEAKKTLQELQKAHDGVIQTILRGIGRGATAGLKDDRDYTERRRKLREEAKRADEAAAGKALQAVGIEETKFTKGDLAAEREKANLKRREAIAAANALEKDEKGRTKFVHDKKAREELIAAANREFAVDKASIDHKEAAQKREIDLENQLTAIKHSGYDVDVRSAEAKFQYAKAALAAANAEQAGAAAAKVRAAAVELEAAVRTKAQKSAADLRKTPQQFDASQIEDFRNQVSGLRQARTREGQLRYESQFRQLTLAEQAELGTSRQTLGEDRHRSDLEREKRFLEYTLAGQYNLIPPGEEDRASVFLGSEGADKFRRRRERLAAIDEELASDNSRRGTAQTGQPLTKAQQAALTAKDLEYAGVDLKFAGKELREAAIELKKSVTNQ